MKLVEAAGLDSTEDGAAASLVNLAHAFGQANPTN
jgi:hypothetical protein